MGRQRHAGRKGTISWGRVATHIASNNAEIETSRSNSEIEQESEAPTEEEMLLWRGGRYITPRIEYDPGHIAHILSRAPERVLFMVDTSLFDNETDHRIWEALFRRHGKVGIIPPVETELKPWIDRHPDHPAAKAVVERVPAIEIMSIDQDHDPTVFLFTHYVNLLGVRKNSFMLLDGALEKELGRPPTQEEKRKIRGEQHDRVTGPFGHSLAKKGEAAFESPNFFTDEELVTYAVLSALERRREIVILTKDEDLQEQLYKLLHIMRTQFMGMLLASKYQASPGEFQTHDPPRGISALEDYLDLTDAILVERTASLDGNLYPREEHLLIHCWVIGKTMSQFTSGIHPGIRDLLIVKGKTRGLSTDLLGGRNCHYWLEPIEGLPESVIKCAIIARDKGLVFGKAAISAVDFHLAMSSAAPCSEVYRSYHDDAGDNADTGKHPFTRLLQ